MTTEYFRVRNGLAVGEDKLTVDAATGNTQVEGNLVVTGDLTINGTTTTLNTDTLNVEDNEIVLNSGVTGSATLDAAIIVNRGTDTDSSLTWNETADKWYQNRSGTSTVIPVNTTELTEGDNLYYTDTRARASISASDTGGDGSLSYDNGTGVITYTGPSASEVRAHFSGGTGVSITDGVVAIGQGVGTGDSPSFAGTTSGNLTVGVSTDNTIASTDTNGNITLAPNGSGDIVLTLANGGNLTNSRNYVFGAIRNSTTEANGEVWTFGPAGTGFKGISLDNSADTADGPATLLRSFSGGAVSGSGTRGRVVFEKARGTAASPTAIQSADQLGSVEATGYTSTGWLADTLAVMPAVFNFNATENWVSNTNLGTTSQLFLAPTATTISTGANLVPVLTVNPQTFASRSDAYTWSQGKSGTTQNMSLDSSGNLTVRGDLTITGNDIKNSGGSNVITMSSGNTQTSITSNLVSVREPTTLSTYNNASNLSIGSGNPAGASFNDRVSQLRATTASTTAGEASTITFNTGNYNTGTKLFSATQSGDTLGEFFFAGNYDTTTSFTTLGPSVRFKALAAENFTGTNSGGKFVISLDKIGGNTQYDSISIDSGNASISSDAIAFKNSAGTSIVGSSGITYNRVYGQFEYNTTVTPAATNTAYVFPLGSAVSNNIATVASTSRLIPGAAGVYNIQFSAQVKNDNSQEHTAYIFLVKNGTAVTNSTGQVTILKQSSQIVSWNYLVTSANTTDYWEIGYAVDSTQITFPAFASTAFAPSAASIITTITPVGA